MPSFKFIWPAVHDFSQTKPKNTPNIWLFWQRKTFGQKFGQICIIQKRFEHNWIKNGRAVKFNFGTLFANLDFLNFIACAIVQWWPEDRQTSLLSCISTGDCVYFSSEGSGKMDLNLQESPCVPPPAYHLHRPRLHQQSHCLLWDFRMLAWHFLWSHSTADKAFLTFWM